MIKSLASIELYYAALAEVEYAKKRAWETPRRCKRRRPGFGIAVACRIDKMAERFQPAAGVDSREMRRAYPQFMAAGGQDLPRDILVHIFPIDTGISSASIPSRTSLDPYLIAALIAQESTFCRASARMRTRTG